MSHDHHHHDHATGNVRIHTNSLSFTSYLFMVAASLINVVLNLALEPNFAWAVWPVAMYSFGW